MRMVTCRSEVGRLSLVIWLITSGTILLVTVLLAGGLANMPKSWNTGALAAIAEDGQTTDDLATHRLLPGTVGLHRDPGECSPGQPYENEG